MHKRGLSGLGFNLSPSSQKRDMSAWKSFKYQKIGLPFSVFFFSCTSPVLNFLDGLKLGIYYSVSVDFIV